jgi:hypothetical protein
MQAILHAASEAALVMHNERLADPLDTMTRAIAAVSKKRAKTITDHEEISRLEFFGGLYTTVPIEFEDGEVVVPDGAVPTIPAWNLLRCLQDGAKRNKRGLDVLRGVHPIAEFADLGYDGETDPAAMWKSQQYVLRKTVGVQRARTTRTRPIFTDWTLTLPVEIDPEVFDLDSLAHSWVMAGRYAGLGEMRPVYGRFEGTVQS